MNDILNRITRTLTVFLSLLLAVNVLPLSVSAADGAFSYRLTADGTATITGYSGSATAVTVPGEIDGAVVTAIGQQAFFNRSSLTELTMPDSIEKIGDSAFAGCAGLKQLDLSGNVTSVGYSAFSGCTALTAIRVSPENPSYASDENGVLFDKGYTTLIQYPTGRPADRYETPDTVRVIGDFAFSRCTALTTLTLPERLTSIGSNAFEGCTGLTTLTIPAATAAIGYNALKDCSSLTAFQVSPNNTHFACDADGVLFDHGRQTLLRYPVGSAQSAYRVPDGVTKIAYAAFEGCGLLTELTVPGSVTTIEGDAFSRCTGLKTVRLTEGLKDIGGGAFRGCRALTEIVLPDSVKTLGSSVFEGCSALTRVTLSGGLTEIADYAFSSCTGLVRLTVPDGIKTLKNAAFYDCSGLSELFLPKSVTTVGGGAFNYCTALKTVYYGGSEADWQSVAVSPDRNTALTAASMVYRATGLPEPSEKPSAVPTSTTPPTTVRADAKLSAASADVKIDETAKTVRIARGHTVGDRYALFTNSGLCILDAGKPCADGTKIGTGQTVRVLDAAGGALSDYAVIVPMDVTGDGVVNSSDARAILRSSARLATLTGVYAEAANCDANPAVNSADARHVLRVAARLEAYTI